MQGARSIINSEIANRVSIYYTTLSSVIIAAAFVLQISDLNQIFVLLGSLAFPLIILMGFFTVAKLAILGTMDSIYIKSINRIRHFYYQSTPEIEQFMIFPPFDDDNSNGLYGGWFARSIRDNLLSASNTVVISNSIVMSLLIGAMITDFDNFTFWGTLPMILIIFVASYILHYYVTFLFVKPTILREEYKETCFPSPDSEISSNPPPSKD